MSSVTRLLRQIVSLDETDYAFRKRRMIHDNLDWLLNKTAVMFDYENLPPTIPKIALERLLQWCGSCAIWRVPSVHKPIGYGVSFNYSSLPGQTDSDLYAFNYTLADAPDPYQEPYKAIITSPGFNPTISETLIINKDVVIIRNDTNYCGLYNLHKKYAELLAEAELSLRSTLLVLRDELLFIAKTEKQRRAVEAYINARDVGQPSFIVSQDLGTPLETIAQNTHSNAVELAVNGLQAIKAAWYNEIGLDPSFSLKREYTSAQEIGENTDLLMPIIDDMFESRRIGIENVNAMFGTNITVKRSSAWEYKEKSVQLGIAMEKAEVDLANAQADTASSLPGQTDTGEGGEDVAEDGIEIIDRTDS